MSADEARLVLDAVGHRWGDGHPLFEGVDADLRRGDVVALTGPSGSGKSTLLSIIAGWLTPAFGRVERRGGGHVHWVFQNPHGQPRRRARDHVVYPFLASGVRRSEAEGRAEDLLAMFGLRGRGDRLFSDLSGGEAQRLMLARAVATKPALLLVDEPTAQLDRASAQAVNEVLAQLADAGAIVVIASHNIETVRVCSGLIDLGDSR